MTTPESEVSQSRLQVFRFRSAARTGLWRRRSLTAPAPVARSGGVEPLVLRSIGAQLARGSAVVAVLIDGADVHALERAVAQCGGEVLADERVSARALVELGEWLAERVATAQSTMRGSPP